MKRTASLLFALFAFLIINANPVVPKPLIITELHFDNDGKWTMELLVDTFYGGKTIHLESFKLETSSGESIFKQGLKVNKSCILVINSDSMQTPLCINNSGDFINFKEFHNGDWYHTSFSLRFGNIENAVVGAPNPKQSIELIIITIWDDKEYIYVKSINPSLGEFPSSPLCIGILQGNVYDAGNNPIPENSVKLSYYPYMPSDYHEMYTDKNGYYQRYMDSRVYMLMVCNLKGKTLQYKTIVVEPDSTITCDFYLDTLFSGIKTFSSLKDIEMSNFPNPFSAITSINIQFPASINNKNAIVKIFDNSGEIVKILPIDSYLKNDNNYVIQIDNKIIPSFNSGIYYYCLEIDGRKIASNKMTYIR